MEEIDPKKAGQIKIDHLVKEVFKKVYIPPLGSVSYLEDRPSAKPVGDDDVSAGYVRASCGVGAYTGLVKGTHKRSQPCPRVIEPARGRIGIDTSLASSSDSVPPIPYWRAPRRPWRPRRRRRRAASTRPGGARSTGGRGLHLGEDVQCGNETKVCGSGGRCAACRRRPSVGSAC